MRAVRDVARDADEDETDGLGLTCGLVGRAEGEDRMLGQDVVTHWRSAGCRRGGQRSSGRSSTVTRDANTRGAHETISVVRPRRLRASRSVSAGGLDALDADYPHSCRRPERLPSSVPCPQDADAGCRR